MTKSAITLCLFGILAAACGSSTGSVAAVSVSADQSTAASTDRAATIQTEKQDEFVHLEREAWNKMQENLLVYFTEDGAAHLKFMVYHATAADLCDDIAMDTTKAAQMVLSMHPENWEQLSDQDKATWNTKFIGNYGMVYGIMLAEHTHNIDAFCAEARALAADPEGGSLFRVPERKPGA